MDVLYERCAGLDVYKDTVVAYARIVRGGKAEREIRTFGTTTRELLGLSDWLADHGCTHVLARLNKAPIAIEAVARTDALFAIEREINGKPPSQRQRVRQEHSRPRVEALEAWLREQYDRLSRLARSTRRSPTASTAGTACPASSTTAACA